jgi:hypothetical protein
LAFISDEGVPTFRRISACRQNIPDTGPTQVYALERTYRITSGYRKGCVVPWADLEGNEHYQPAGIDRQLIYAPISTAFHEYHQSDHIVFKLLRKLPDFENRVTLVSHMPDVYLTYRPDQAAELSLRGTGEAVRWLRSEVCDIDKLSDAQLLCVNHRFLAEDAGRGRLALPYGKVYGRGIVASGEGYGFEFDTWVRVEDITATLNYVEIAHELKDVLRHKECA